MTLEKTIQRMFNECPMLFRNRDECLNHLFCTIGNGYTWIDGELININDINFDIINFEILSIDEPEIILKGNNVAKQTILDKAYDKFRQKNPFEWDLIEDCSYIVSYPKNIKEDWLNGIKETKKKIGI